MQSSQHSRIKRFIRAAPLFFGLALGSVAQTTVSDPFTSTHDYKTNGVGGTIWSGILNAGAISVADANSSQAGALRLASTTNTGWEGSKNTAAFLYINVPANSDFTAQAVLLDVSPQVNYNTFGLMARAAGSVGALSAENWVSGMFANFGSFINVDRFRSVVSGAESNYPTSSGLPYGKYLELKRVGNTFTFSASTTSFSSLSVVSSISRTDMDSSGTLQVGMWVATFSGDSGYANIDSFSLTSVPEPSAYAALLGVAALGWVGWRRFRRN